MFVTYQLILDNGTTFNLSSDQDCRSELWVWLSSPAFLYLQPTYLNRMLLFTLNYFMEWISPHVFITTTVAPCTDQTTDFLNRMTTAVSLSLQLQYRIIYLITISCWFLSSLYFIFAASRLCTGTNGVQNKPGLRAARMWDICI